MRALLKLATTVAAPAEDDVIPAAWRHVAEGYCELLSCTNGLIVDDGVLRVFGIGDRSLVRDAIAWNEHVWRNRFPVPSDVLFWGESVFGDQFGVSLSSGELLVLWCEDGVLEPLGIELPQFFDVVAALATGGLIDKRLAYEARNAGLAPNPGQHLSFSAPLVLGGENEIENLEVLDAVAHLDLLGQVHAQVRGLEPGTKIARFDEGK